MKITDTSEFGTDTLAALALKDQQEVNMLQTWHETDEKAAEHSRRLRNILGGTALAGYGVLAAVHYGEGVALNNLTLASAGLGVLMNSATRKHGDVKLNEKMADRSATQMANIAERINPGVEVNEPEARTDETLPLAA